MSSFQSLLNVLKTIDSLPENMYNSIVPHFDSEYFNASLDAIQAGLKDCLIEETELDLKDYSKEQAQDFFSCMSFGSIHKVDMREWLLEEQCDSKGKTVLERLCSVNATHDSRCLGALKHFRGLDVFQQSEIVKKRLATSV